jgi:FkbH-like protein
MYGDIRLSSHSGLSWLCPAPSDFNERCRSLVGDPRDAVAELRAIAGTCLNENQLTRLASAINRLRAAGYSLEPLTPFRLVYLSNATADLITPALVATAVRHNIDLTCSSSGYDQAIQEALDPQSGTHRSRPDAVLVGLDYRAFPFQAGPSSGPADFVQAVTSRLEAICQGVKANGAASVILQTIAPPPERLFGSFDRTLPGTLLHAIDRANLAIADLVRQHGGALLDVAGLAATVGLANWHAPRDWDLAKAPFASAFIPLYADHACRVLAALRGKSRRCVVVDLDNTLWGGVIGDDGLHGIRICQGDPVGEAFLGFQRYLLALRERGIVLAVSSKNEDETARLPFREHPEMLLHEEHFAAFQANWNNKAANIQVISDLLSLGLESFVFIDDNPFERELIRRTLPQVAVPELPDDPALYTRTVSDAGYFEAVSFSEEDHKRASFYEDNARRARLQLQIADLDTYLASLQMEISFSPFDPVRRGRITQLINKSNQFNLTTRRYSEEEVKCMEASPEFFTLQVSLKDAFGDNGLISVVICRRISAAEWEIDTWLMSCRVLGRRVENMVLREILGHASAEGVSRLVASYLPTGRNRLVERHYPNLGFQLLEEVPGGATRWGLDVAAADVPAAPMTVRSEAFCAATAGR